MKLFYNILALGFLTVTALSLKAYDTTTDTHLKIVKGYKNDLVKEKTKVCNILALSGGGSHAAFEAGVTTKLIKEKGKTWDHLSGISAGSINAVYYSAYNISDLNDLLIASSKMHDIWVSLKQDDFYVLNKGMPWNWQSIYNTDPMRKTLTSYMADLQIKSSINVGAVKLTDGQMKIFTQNEIVKNAVSIMMASSSIPILFPPTFLNDEYYIDGGDFSNIIIPSNLCGNEEIIQVDAILNSQTISVISPKDIKDMNMLGLLQRTLDIVSNAFFNHEIYNSVLCQNPKGVIHVYQPSYNINSSMLNFDHNEEIYQLGLKVGEPTDYLIC
jgi:predicted acylesterase/phospholipase RssA